MSDFEFFLQQFINSISLGSIYALVALGYTMVYGIVGLINFAHGDILMIGAYTGYFVMSSYGTSPFCFILGFVAAMTVCGITGILIERFAYKPLRSAPRLNSLITAIAVSLLIQNGARVLPFIGPTPRRFVTLDSYSISIFGNLNISNIQLIVILVSIILMILLTYIIQGTKTGRAMRAVSFDLQAASLMGISVNKIVAFTFALGSVLAAAGGILYASAYPQITPTMGSTPGLKAFIAAVLGGIGSVPGAMVGGYILGLAETMAKAYLSSRFSDAISFTLLIIILLVRPNGILGKKVRVKV